MLAPNLITLKMNFGNNYLSPCEMQSKHDMNDLLPIFQNTIYQLKISVFSHE